MANKKINQLVAKTTIQSTDLFPLGDATTGQLFKKTIADLQAAIGGAVISVNGLTGALVLDTDDIQELASPTNRYFTEARSRAAISLTTTGSSGASTYSSSTGVLNVPTYTLAGLGGITASFLSGTSGISYNSSTGVISYTGTVYTDASIRALVSATGNISYNSSTGVFSTSLTQYTDALARATLSGTAPITYNSTTGAIGITQATTSTNGYLSSTDWNTFNGKQSTLTLGNFTEATSSVLTITGGTGAIIGSGLSVQVKQATTSVSGFLSSTDWNTFNGKQNTITNPVTGTGTSGYHAKWTSGTAIGNGIIYDDGNQIGINVTPPTWFTNFKGLNLPNGSFIGYSTNGSIFLSQNLYFNSGGSWTFINTGTGGQHSIDGTGNHTFYTAASGSAGTAATLVERMRISAAGNVGIGTTSPTGLLQLNGSISNSADSAAFTIKQSSTSYNNGIYLERSGERNGYHIYIGGGADALTFRRNYFGTQSDVMSLTRDGNVGINTTTPGGKLQVSGGDRGTGIRVESSTNAAIAFYNSTSVREYQIFSQSTGDFSIYDETSGAYRFKIKSSGNVLIDTTTDNGEKLYVNGSIRATGSITANSDVRLKKNIERIENALQKVSEISGYTYNTIYDEDRHAGVIAQEIDKVLPEIVNKGNDGLMGVEYGNISALLIEAIKDLKVQNDSLQARLSALEK